MAPRRELLTLRSGGFDLMATVDLPDGVFQSDAAPGKYPGVLFCHGFTGHRIESRRLYARLAARLAAQGIGCLRFDHRGCGESDGDFLDFTPAGMLEDLHAALTAFKALPWLDHQRMAVVGYSLGGTSASYLTTLEPNFVTAVLWAPVARPDIIRDRLSQYPGFAGYRERGYFDYGGFRVSPDYLERIGALTPVEWLAGFVGPVLFIHGQDDPIVRPEQSDRYLSARRHAADRKILLTDADHSFTTAANLDIVIERSEQWLVEKLKG